MHALKRSDSRPALTRDHDAVDVARDRLRSVPDIRLAALRPGKQLQSARARGLIDQCPMRASSILGTLFAVLLTPSNARAQPWFGWGENSLEDAYADGDFDEADVDIASAAGLRPGSNQMHGETWLSLAGFSRELESGRTDVGGFVVVGLALDRLAAGNVRRVAERPSSVPAVLPSSPPSVADPSAVTADPSPAAVVSPSTARACVRAALHASGLDADDDRIDALAARARASAWLPETRMRAMRLLDTTQQATTLTTTDGVNYYDTAGANLVLELRLTWRLDRVLYSGDEPTLERLRLEREQARSHVATRAIEALFAWQRAVADRERAPAGSREEVEARLRASEARTVLDVLTDGWFTERGPGAGPDAR